MSSNPKDNPKKGKNNHGNVHTVASRAYKKIEERMAIVARVHLHPVTSRGRGSGFDSSSCFSLSWACVPLGGTKVSIVVVSVVVISDAGRSLGYSGVILRYRKVLARRASLNDRPAVLIWSCDCSCRGFI